MVGPKEKSQEDTNCDWRSNAAFAIAIAAPASAHDAGEEVTRNFEQAIPNIPGKSLIAVVVDYPPGGASPPHTHAKSAFIYAYVISGRIESRSRMKIPSIAIVATLAAIAALPVGLTRGVAPFTCEELAAASHIFSQSLGASGRRGANL